MRILKTDEEKIKYLEKYADNVEMIPEDEIEYYKKCVEEGCEKNWVVALHVKAYGCYGGDILFEEDWYASRDCLLKLVDLTAEPEYYNTLGYIYYYGRCNGKVPEYEKAFQYFSVGAANGIYESIYKIADMFIAGKGCLKHEMAGVRMIASLYDENKEKFCEGEYGGKLADVALRMAGIFEKGLCGEVNLKEAYSFYLEAKTAIDIRMKYHDYYGDGKVRKSIYEGLERVKKQLPDDFFANGIAIDNPYPFGEMLRHSVGLDIVIDYEDGRYSLKADAVREPDSTEKALINLPELDYCKLADSVKCYLEYDAVINKDITTPYKAFITGITYDEDNDIWLLRHREAVLVAIKSDHFVFEKTYLDKNC